MAGCQRPSDNTSSQVTSVDIIQQPNALVTELKAMYPQCNITEISNPRGHNLLSVQPKKDLDLKLEFRIHQAQPKKSQELIFMSVASNILTKKDSQRLQRSLELQIPVSTKGQELEEAINTVNDFVKYEGLYERNSCMPAKRKDKKNRTKNVEHEVNSIEERNAESAIPAPKTKRKRSRRRTRGMAVENSDEDSCEEGSPVNYQLISPFREQDQEVPCSSLPMSARPTHFIAVRVTCTTILDSLTSVQNDLVLQEPLLEKGAFAPEIFHLTLFTLGLDTQEDIGNCIEALTEMRPTLEKIRPLHPFVIYSMSQFYNRAIFAKVKIEQDFIDFRENMRSELENSNVEIRDMYEKFNPHLTIIKVKRPERKLFGSRNIQPAIYSHLKETVFGEQKVNDIHLCPMDGQRREDGFYTSLFEMKFNC